MALHRAIDWADSLADANTGSPWNPSYKKSSDYLEAIERKTWFELALKRIPKVSK
jgi:hypothetical protein